MTDESLSCDEVCWALWPCPEPGGPAWIHYAGCRDCQQVFARERVLVLRLKKIDAIGAPGGLRLRIAEVILTR